MPSKLKPVNGREVLRKLQRAGFVITRTRGSMRQLKHPTTERVTYVHVHGSKDIPRGTLRAIVSQAGLTVDEFNAL